MFPPNWVPEDEPEATTTTERRPSEDERVENWRALELMRAGYPGEIATQLAARPPHEVDLHHAVELVSRGCTPELAAEILL